MVLLPHPNTTINNIYNVLSITSEDWDCCTDQRSVMYYFLPVLLVTFLLYVEINEENLCILTRLSKDATFYLMLGWFW